MKFHVSKPSDCY